MKKNPPLKFLEVAEKIEKEISKLPEGSLVPSTTWWREKLGVSRTTISRAFLELKNAGKLATKVGFGTVTAVKARVKTVLVVWGANTIRRHSLHGSEFLSGASEHAEQCGDVLLSPILASDLVNVASLKHLFPGLAGVIFFRCPKVAQELNLKLTQEKIPWVLYGSSVYAQVPNGLAVDEDQVVGLAMEELLTYGHKSIGMFYRKDHVAGLARLEAWKKWYGKKKLTWQADWIFEDDPTKQNDEEKKLKTWLKNLSAVFCATDAQALRLMELARPLGFRFPEDLSVIGVDNQYFCKILIPSISSVDIPIGYHGKLCLAALLEGNLTKKHKLTRDAVLVKRETVARKK
jgi:DNA-binding LacI/PurR family transcriptional regulator